MTRVAQLSSPLRRFDAPINVFHDHLNARLARLWWPLKPPAADRRLEGPEHALYAAHVGIALVAVLLLPLPRRSSTGMIALLGAVSWVVFSGAWDRRADAYAEAASADRRSR